jgi:hypothetical protein
VKDIHGKYKNKAHNSDHKFFKGRDNLVHPHTYCGIKVNLTTVIRGHAAGGAVGSGTVLQAGRLRV